MKKITAKAAAIAAAGLIAGCGASSAPHAASSRGTSSAAAASSPSAAGSREPEVFTGRTCYYRLAYPAGVLYRISYVQGSDAHGAKHSTGPECKGSLTNGAGGMADPMFAVTLPPRPAVCVRDFAAWSDALGGWHPASVDTVYSTTADESGARTFCATLTRAGGT
jgi:hypothetical protein